MINLFFLVYINSGCWWESVAFRAHLLDILGVTAPENRTRGKEQPTPRNLSRPHNKLETQDRATGPLPSVGTLILGQKNIQGSIQGTIHVGWSEHICPTLEPEGVDLQEIHSLGSWVPRLCEFSLRGRKRNINLTFSGSEGRHRTGEGRSCIGTRGYGPTFLPVRTRGRDGWTPPAWHPVFYVPGVLS